VICPPVDTDFYTPGHSERGEGYLCVSALVPYKRVDQAVLACTKLGRPLTVIGEGPERARLEAMAGPTVRFLGWQPDEVIREHYRRCRALLFPGEEDFGIVPIEALACGAPVLALGRGGVAETVDGLVGRTYDTPTTEGLEEAMVAWERDGAPHDPRLARRRAEALSLPVFRDQLLTFLAEVVGASHASPVPPAPHVSVSAGTAPLPSGTRSRESSPGDAGHRPH
jgi:glycosyltransferase involved in cell wall biosynthesis